jgi:hypothetical protein
MEGVTKYAARKSGRKKNRKGIEEKTTECLP